MRSWVAVLVSCLFVGPLTADHCEFPGPEGYKYEYQYSAIVANGILDVAQQVAGVGIRGTIVQETIANRDATFLLRDVSFAQFNEEKHLLDPELIDLDFKRMESDYARHFATPAKVMYEHGLISGIQFESNVPTWVKNVMRGIISLFQFKTSPTGNSDRSSNYVSESGPFVSTFFKVMEQSVVGTCDSFYSVESIPWAGQPDEKVYNITKTKDYRNCEEKVEWTRTTHPAHQCEECEADESHPHSTNVVVNYGIKVEGHNCIIEDINADGLTVFAPYGLNSDKLHSIQNQTVELVGYKRSEGSSYSRYHDQDRRARYIHSRSEDNEYRYGQDSSRPHGGDDDQQNDYRYSQDSSRRHGDDHQQNDYRYSQDSSHRHGGDDDQQNDYRYSQDSSRRHGGDDDQQNDYRYSQDSSRRHGGDDDQQNDYRYSQDSSRRHGGDDDQQNDYRYSQDSSHRHGDDDQQNDYRYNQDSSRRQGGDDDQQNDYRYSQDSSRRHGGDDDQQNDYRYGRYPSRRQGGEDDQQNDYRYNQYSSRRHGGDDDDTTVSFNFTTLTYGDAETLRIPDLHLANPTMVPYSKGNHLEQARKLIHEIVNEVGKDVPELQQTRYVPGKLTLLRRIFQTAHYAELEKFVYEHVRGHSEHYDEASLVRSLTLDVLAMTGTNPALKMITKLITERIVYGERAAQMIQSLPTYILDPSEPVLEEVLRLAKSQVVAQHEQLYTTSWMALGTLVQYSARPDQIKPTPPLLETYGDRQVARKYIQHIAHELERAQEPARKLALVTALGNIGMQDIIEPLEPYITGKATDSMLLKARAIFSLKHLVKRFPHLIADLLLPVFFNSMEESEVRIAAFKMIVAANPSRHLFEKIAASTWYETDDTVGGMVYETFRSLANVSHPCLAPLSSHAQLAFELSNDDFDNGIHVASNFYFDRQLDDMDLATFMQAMFVGESGSIFPSMVYTRLERLVSGYSSHAYEFGFLAQGVKSALDQIIGPVGAYIKDADLYDILKNLDTPNKNKGFKTIVDAIKIKPLEDDDTEMLFHLRLLGGTQTRQLYVDTKKIVEWVNNGMIPLREITKRLSEGIDINMHKAWMQFSLTHATPSEIGLPLVLSVKAPSYFTVKGSIKVQGLEELIRNIQSKGASGQYKLQIEVDLHPAVASQKVVTFGVVLPHERVTAVAGYDTVSAAHIPVHADLKIGYEHEQFHFHVVNRNKNTQGSNSLAYFHTRPYTMIYPYESFRLPNQFYKVIRIWETPKRFQRQIGYEYSPLVLKGTHEVFWDSHASVYHYLNHRSFLGLISFPTVTQQWRMREYVIEYNHELIPSEYEATFTWKYNHAESDPEYTPRRSLLGVWGWITGWGNLPYQGKDDSTTGEQPWEQTYSKYHEREGYETSARSYGRWDRSDRSEETDSNENDNSDRWSYKPRHQQYDESHDTSEYSQYKQYREGGERGHYNTENGVRGRYHSKVLHSDTSYPNSLTLEEKEFAKGVSTLDLEAIFKVKGSILERAIKFNLKLRSDRAELTHDIKAEVDFGRSTKVHLEGNVNYPHPPRYYGKTLPSATPQEKIRSWFKVRWGSESSSSPAGYVHFTTELKKSEQQQRYESMPPSSHIQPWFHHQCEKDLAKGFPLSYACQLHVDHLAELHKLVVDVEWQNVPTILKNLTLRTDMWVKYILYPQMSYNPYPHELSIPEGSNKARVVAQFHYAVPALDIEIEKPHERTTFSKWFYPATFPWLQAPSTRYSYPEIIGDYLTDGDLQPDCTISGRYVNTFDNETYGFNYPGSCNYVVAKDCTESNLFAVLISKDDSEQHKQLTVRVLKHEIEIDPSSKDSESEILIDGKPERISNQKIVYIRDPEYEQRIIAYIVKTAPVYVVVLPEIAVRVEFDGYNAQVLASHFWREKVCGMCGDFNGETEEEFKGPQGCIWASGDEFARTYAVPDGTCRPPTLPHHKPLCGFYDRPVVTEHYINECEEKRNLRYTLGAKICISVQPYTHCKSPCHDGSRTERVPVDFHCISNADPAARELLHEIEHRPLYELASKSVDFTKEIEIPESCVSRV